jgi:hypothetical protein
MRLLSKKMAIALLAAVLLSLIGLEPTSSGASSALAQGAQQACAAIRIFQKSWPRSTREISKRQSVNS